MVEIKKIVKVKCVPLDVFFQLVKFGTTFLEKIRKNAIFPFFKWT